MMPDKMGYVHSVETFGTVDGPGIRYVLFMAGCRLACAFCHNRDTWEFGEKTAAVPEILDDYERYRSFYDASGGGLTVSGGEPLLQPKFVAALLEACRERQIHTAIDTAGWYHPSALTEVLPHTDLVLFSIKSARSETHRRLTGKPNRRIIENLRQAANSSKLIIRHVIIPGITDREAEFAELAGLVASLPGCPPVELLAYHRLGLPKWQQLAGVYPLADISPATAADMERASEGLTKRGVSLINPPGK